MKKSKKPHRRYFGGKWLENTAGGKPRHRQYKDKGDLQLTCEFLDQISELMTMRWFEAWHQVRGGYWPNCPMIHSDEAMFVNVLRLLGRSYFGVLFLGCFKMPPVKIAAVMHMKYEKCKKISQRLPGMIRRKKLAANN